MDPAFIPIRMFGAKVIDEHFAGADKHTVGDLQAFGPGLPAKNGRHLLTQHFDLTRKDSRHLAGTIVTRVVQGVRPIQVGGRGRFPPT